MFGQFKPVPFDPYGRRRSRWHLPRWLVLLLLGIALGAGAVLLVQERYLPPRLSAEASTKLRSAFEQADAERKRLQGELDTATRDLDAARAAQASLGSERDGGRATIERLQADLALVVAALPPDPRGGGIEVRAGQLTARNGQLAYELVLTRERGARPMPAVLQLRVAGVSASGTETSVALEPIALSIAGHAVARGSVPLPAGLTPRQTTVQLLDRPGGRALGMRVLLVR